MLTLKWIIGVGLASIVAYRYLRQRMRCETCESWSRETQLRQDSNKRLCEFCHYARKFVRDPKNLEDLWT